MRDVVQIVIMCISAITAFLIAIIGWFVKNSLVVFQNKLETHDKIIIQLVGDVQRLIGIVTGKMST